MISQKDYVEARKFLHGYAKTHYRFTGGDVLDSWRATGCKSAQANWRNKWSGVIKHGQTSGWFLKIGRKPATTAQSHVATLALWQSKLFKPVGVSVEVSPLRYLDSIRERIVTGKCSMRDGLMEAYTYGVEQTA